MNFELIKLEIIEREKKNLFEQLIYFQKLNDKKKYISFLLCKFQFLKYNIKIKR